MCKMPSKCQCQGSRPKAALPNLSTRPKNLTFPMLTLTGVPNTVPAQLLPFLHNHNTSCTIAYTFLNSKSPTASDLPLPTEKHTLCRNLKTRKITRLFCCFNASKWLRSMN
jgi:hypothetical protein